MTSVARSEGRRRDGYLDARRSLVDPKLIRELSKQRPARVWRDTLLCWAFIVSAWVGAAVIDQWWAVAAAFVVVGNRFYALFIIGHDGLHRRLFSTVAANDRFNNAFVMAPMGAITRINNRNHLSHHQHLGSEQDPDRYKHACVNKNSRLGVLGYVTAVSSVYLSVRNVFVRGRRSAAAESTGGAGYRLGEAAAILGWQAALVAGLTWAFGWWGYPVLWVLPVFSLTVLADNLRAFLEHSHPEPDEVADAHRLVTNMPRWLERQWLAPMNMNFHAAHHLWPSIPYYNLPKADAALRQAPRAHEVMVWRGSYLGYLRRYLAAVPIVGCGRAEAAAHHA